MFTLVVRTVRPHLHSMHLERIVLDDAWLHRQLPIGVRDATAVPRSVRLPIAPLCTAPQE